MQSRTIVTANGLVFYLSVSPFGTLYIIVVDPYTGEIDMRYFIEYSDALLFIDRLDR
jgi:hypothetical protein